MSNTHDFHATLVEYKQQFKLWEIPKNLKGENWKGIHHKILKRKRDGKDSSVYAFGVKLPKQKVAKQISQQGIFKATDFYGPASPKMPAWISVRTPSPSPAMAYIAGASMASRSSSAPGINDFPLTLCKDHTQCCLRKLVDIGGSEKMVQLLRTAFQEPLVNPQEMPASGVLELTRKNSTISSELRVAIGSGDVTEIKPSDYSGQYLWARSAMYEWHCHNDRDQNKFLRVTVKRLDPTWLSERESLLVHFTVISNTTSRKKTISIDICLYGEASYIPRISRSLRCYNTIYSGSPTYKAVMQNDMGKLQQLFSTGKASPWDMIEHEENLLIMRSAHLGLYEITLFLLQQGSPVRDVHFRVNNILWAIWVGFLERQYSLQGEPLRSLSFTHDFEVCENLSRLALDKGTDAVCVEDTIDFNHLGGDLRYGTLLHLPGNILTGMVDSHVLERMLVYWIRIGVDLEYCNGYGLTPLLWTAALTCPCSTYLLALIRNGADVSATDDKGCGALHLSLSLCHGKHYLNGESCDCLDRYYDFYDEVLHEIKTKLAGLLNAGCDYRLQDLSGRTPSQYIQSEYLWDIWISALESAGKDTTNETRRPVHLPDDPCLYPSTIGNIYENDESNEGYENYEDNEDSDGYDDYEGDYEMNEEDEGDYGTEDLGNENTTLFKGHTQRMENGNQEVKNNHALEVESPQETPRNAAPDESKSMDFSSWIDWSLADL